MNLYKLLSPSLIIFISEYLEDHTSNPKAFPTEAYAP